MATAEFLELLRRLHRDERTSLTGLVLGEAPLPANALVQEVRARLGLELPESSFVAFDFQISAIYAAAVLAEGKRGIQPAGGGIERGNQENVDLLVAWPSNEEVNLLLVEAEGVSGWSGKRLLSRALWLGDVFGYESGNETFPWLKPRFAIASPLPPPDDLPVEEWPQWMTDAEGKPAWLPMPVPQGLLRITKTTPHGQPRGTGGFWHVEPAS